MKCIICFECADDHCGLSFTDTFGGRYVRKTIFYISIPVTLTFDL